jgi:hypothetical protein
LQKSAQNYIFIAEKAGFDKNLSYFLAKLKMGVNFPQTGRRKCGRERARRPFVCPIKSFLAKYGTFFGKTKLSLHLRKQLRIFLCI